MGACFNTATIDGSFTREQVATWFRGLQDTDRFENGASYSGGFGMLCGIEFEDLLFPSVAAAEEHVQEHQEKWGPALAVRARNVVTVATRTPTFAGKPSNYGSLHRRAVETSMSAGRRTVHPADQLEPEEKKRLTELFLAHDRAARDFNDQWCSLKGSIQALEELENPFDGYEGLRKQREQVVLANQRARDAGSALKEYEATLLPRLYEEKQEDRGEVWVVGGWCSS